MKSRNFICTFIIAFCSVQFLAAQNVGINTDTPDRPLEIEGSTNVYLRLNSTNAINGTSGVEFFRSGLGNGTDWRLESTTNKLRILRSENAYASSSIPLTIDNNDFIGLGLVNPSSRLHILGGVDASYTTHGAFMIGSVGADNLVFDANEILARDAGGPTTLYIQNDGGTTSIAAEDGNVGIGLTNPQSKLNVFSGVDASNTEDGAIMVGTKSGYNVVLDGNEILARNNGAASTLYMQFHGGNTSFGENGGDVRIGTPYSNGRLNIQDDLFQIYLRNDTGDDNDWYIGASNSGWVAGDDQLIFSPTGSSGNGILRLRDVSDNDGIVAPLTIASNAGAQKMRFDGNEIDTDSPMYINHNSNENTYINPSGGYVGIGTSNPEHPLHVKTSNAAVFALQRGSWKWTINPRPSDGFLAITRPALALTLASIDAWTGAYSAFSDRRMKEEITVLPDVLSKLDEFQVYTYCMKNDPRKDRHMGVMAQEMLDVFPTAVVERGEYYGVEYDQLTVVALKAAQELADRYEELVQLVDKQNEKMKHQQEQIERLRLQISHN